MATKPSRASRAERKPDRRTVTVDRDSTFFRAYADVTHIMPLGNELEIGLMQFSPNIVSFAEDDTTRQVRVTPNVVEIARVRMDYNAAVDMAMRVLQNAFAKDIVVGETILRSIREWSEAGPTATDQS